ncbi:hypothetical protein EDB86DRAFT_2824588 [Lactarius hatsudake]|nr:hypothetical protein EDB86DRAFT_2824588 [Lactarius hatsudake]
MCNPDNRPTVRHDFFSDGDVIIRVEDTVFCIHAFFLTRESNHFRSMLASTVPCRRCRETPGTSESNPIVLRDATSEAFSDLLWVFYNPEYSNYSGATLEKWKRILALAQQWGFVQVEQLCVRELEKLTIPPVEKIKIYQDFNLNPKLLYDSCVELVIRPEPLNLEEGGKVGFLTSMKIMHARELALARATGPDGASSSSGSATIQLQESEIQLAIRDIFRLWESAPAPMAPPPQPMTTDMQSPTGDGRVDEIVPQTRNRQSATSDDHGDEVVPLARRQTQRSASRATVSDIFGLQVSTPPPSPPRPTTTDRQNPSGDDHVDEDVPQTRRQTRRSASRATVSSDIFELQGSTSPPVTDRCQRQRQLARQNPSRDGHVDEVVPQSRSASRTAVSPVVPASVTGGRSIVGADNVFVLCSVLIATGHQCATLPVSSDRSRPCATPLADLDDIGASAGTAAQTVSYPFEVNLGGDVTYGSEVTTASTLSAQYSVLSDRTGARPSGTNRDHWHPGPTMVHGARLTDDTMTGGTRRWTASLTDFNPAPRLRLAPLPTTATVGPTRAMSQTIYFHRIQAPPLILGPTTTALNNTHRRRSRQHTTRTCPGYPARQPKKQKPFVALAEPSDENFIKSHHFKKEPHSPQTNPSEESPKDGSQPDAHQLSIEEKLERSNKSDWSQGQTNAINWKRRTFYRAIDERYERPGVVSKGNKWQFSQTLSTEGSAEQALRRDSDVYTGHNQQHRQRMSVNHLVREIQREWIV